MVNHWKVRRNLTLNDEIIVKSYMRIYQRMPNIGAFFQVAAIPERPYIESKNI